MKSRATVRMTTCVLAACLGGVGCDTPPDSTGGDRSSTQPPARTTATERGIQGTELYRKDVGRAHTVHLYELAPGRTAIRESLSMDSGEKELMETFGHWTSLAEVYTKLNPGSTEVPGQILEADQRAVVRALRTSDQGPALPAPAPTGEASTPSQAILSGSQASCSGDYYGDGWGGQWFINNYCNAGAFRWCQKNWGWADSGTFSNRPWASWRQMEGDFNVSGHINGTIVDCHWYGCDPRKNLFDYDVLPRRIEVWNYGQTDDWYTVTGTSPCGHLHVAFLRN